jgi:glycosyltransferase involved in cell wall biosynthesis
MKTVCLIVQNVYDIDPRVRRKAEALAASGYDVDVLALRGETSEKRYRLNGVKVRTFALDKKRGSLTRYLFEFGAFYIWAFWRISWQMLHRRYAVIDVNTLPDFLIFAPILAKWMGATLVLDMHEIAPEFYISKYGCASESLPVRVLRFLERASMMFADRVITINEPIEALLTSRGLPAWKSTVIMNAVDEERFFSCTSTLNCREAAGQAAFVFMYHGTLTHIYGLDIAVEAFARAHKDMPGAELWILGSGTSKDGLRELACTAGIEEKVRLFGRVAASDIPMWLKRSDVGILPIRQDVFLDFAFPNKLPEFIVMGKPVVVSRLRTIRHYFSEDALAYFTACDSTDLARQMVRLYRNPELRVRLAEGAKREYAPMCWELMRRRYVGLVDELAGPVRNPGLDVFASDRAPAVTDKTGRAS